MHLIPRLALAAACWIACGSASTGEPAATTTRIPVYSLDGPLTESGVVESSLVDGPPDDQRPVTHFDLIRSLSRAAKDAEVKGVAVHADNAEMNFAQLQEIRRRLLDIRKAGKDVWFYTENLTNATALIGSTANHFALLPAAEIDFHGIHAESMYFKELLDKAGVRAEVIHIGDYKSFGEEFWRTGPSDEARQQEEALVGSVFDQIVADVTSARNLPVEHVLAVINDGTTDAAGIVAAGLADRLMHRTDFVKQLRETYGEEADFDNAYQMPESDGPSLGNLLGLLKLGSGNDTNTGHRRDFVAVVAMEGDITDESVGTVRSQILALLKEPKAKALVLRIDSPGGSALASEVLWEATDEWKTSGKPLVASMGGTAASGGYYIACGANRIFAEPGTITGSIGVVGMKFVFDAALAKLGIHTHSVSRGRLAGWSSPTRGYTPEEREIVRESMRKTYAMFKQRVSDGRGKSLRQDLEALAGGRVYTGAQALQFGLVDEIGGLRESVHHASTLAGLDKPDIKLLPQPQSPLERFLDPTSLPDDGEIIRTKATDGFARGLLATLRGNPMAGLLPGRAWAAVGRVLHRIQAFQQSRVLLLGPDIDLR
ncbi:MAG: signal peptide peptidase SppA [Verrucomicrobia bacterium]|nr:signal peptide peptidase SppA [Verrucomicrobiota bacterium]